MDNVEIIRQNGLRREVWNFSLYISYGGSCIYFDHYEAQEKASPRHRKWTPFSHWDRLMQRYNTTTNPPSPLDVVDEMRSRFQNYIMQLPLRK